MCAFNFQGGRLSEHRVMRMLPSTIRKSHRVVRMPDVMRRLARVSRSWDINRQRLCKVSEADCI